MSIEAQVNEIFAASRSYICWGSRLTGEAKELVEQLQKSEADGQFVPRVKAASVLERDYGIKISANTFKQHLVGNCSCQ